MYLNEIIKVFKDWSLNSFSIMSTSGDHLVQALLDTETPKTEQFTDVFALIDRLKVCMMTTVHSDGRLTSRAMRVHWRDHIDFWFTY